MLTVPIWVNNTEVGRVELVRIEPGLVARPNEGEMCTYHMKYYDGSPRAKINTVVNHPYVTGNPLPLVQTALTKIQELLSE